MFCFFGRPKNLSFKTFFFPFMISKTVFCANAAYKSFKFGSKKNYLRTRESVPQENKAGAGSFGVLFLGGFFWFLLM